MLFLGQKGGTFGKGCQLTPCRGEGRGSKPLEGVEIDCSGPQTRNRALPRFLIFKFSFLEVSGRFFWVKRGVLLEKAAN